MNALFRSIARSAMPLLLLALPAALHAQTAEDEAAIRALLHAHGEADTRRDVQASTDAYHPDADVGGARGVPVVGREQIEQMHVRRFASQSRKTGRTHSHPEETLRIRFIRPDVALVDVDTYAWGGADESGQAMPTTTSRLFVVFTKEKGAWRVISQRSMGAVPQTRPAGGR